MLELPAASPSKDAVVFHESVERTAPFLNSYVTVLVHERDLEHSFKYPLDFHFGV